MKVKLMQICVLRDRVHLNLKLVVISKMYLGLDEGFFRFWECTLRTKKLVHQGWGCIVPIFSHLKDNLSYMANFS